MKKLGSSVYRGRVCCGVGFNFFHPAEGYNDVAAISSSELASARQWLWRWTFKKCSDENNASIYYPFHRGIVPSPGAFLHRLASQVHSCSSGPLSPRIFRISIVDQTSGNVLVAAAKS